MDFALPEHLPGLLAEMDAFIEAEIKPLEAENMQYFDRRREFARTDLENDGIPQRAWDNLLDEMRRRADSAGWLRYGLPSRFGGRDGTNLDMAVIREHLAHKGLGLHNDLQDESSIVGNFPQVIMMERFGTEVQRKENSEKLTIFAGKHGLRLVGTALQSRHECEVRARVRDLPAMRDWYQTGRVVQAGFQIRP